MHICFGYIRERNVCGVGHWLSSPRSAEEGRGLGKLRRANSLQPLGNSGKKERGLYGHAVMTLIASLNSRNQSDKSPCVDGVMAMTWHRWIVFGLVLVVNPV